MTRKGPSKTDSTRMLNISATELLTVIAGAAGLVTAIWHAAMYVGKLTVTMGRHEDRLNKHEEKLSDHDDELRFLKGIPR